MPDSKEILAWQFNKVWGALLTKCDPRIRNASLQYALDVLHSISCAVTEHEFISGWNAKRGLPCDCGYCTERLSKTSTEVLVENSVD